jgi:hypothetical protein
MEWVAGFRKSFAVLAEGCGLEQGLKSLSLNFLFKI